MTKIDIVRQCLGFGLEDPTAIAKYARSNYGVDIHKAYIGVLKNLVRKERLLQQNTGTPVVIPIRQEPDCLEVIGSILECVSKVAPDSLICLVRNVNRLGENGLVNLIQKAANHV